MVVEVIIIKVMKNIYLSDVEIAIFMSGGTYLENFAAGATSLGVSLPMALFHDSSTNSASAINAIIATYIWSNSKSDHHDADNSSSFKTNEIAIIATVVIII